jgi:phenylpropionate dioxygenase-like ring-hydroxylating dioxygenase large terminal subunit
MAHQKEKLVGLAKRLLNHNLNGTTDQADEIMIKPVSDYTDDNLIKSEVDKIFYDHPVPIALSSELKENNSYKATKAIDTPVLVTRDNNGVIRAFINICKHRGAPCMSRGQWN